MEIKERINFITEECDEGKRIDVFLNEEMEDFSRSYVQKLIKDGFVYLGNGKKLKQSYKLSKKEEICVDIPENEELKIEAENLELNIVYEDSDILIVNKDPYMVVHPAAGHYSNTLVNGLLYHIKDLSGINGVARPGIVHRLDKDTSGLIIVAKNDDSHRELVRMFSEHEIKKTYIAIVKGILKTKTGRIENIIGRNPSDRKQMAVVDKNGKKAITNYFVLEEKDDFSFVKVNIETGRTHQIRVHMKYINHPILGDEIYGRKSELAKRQMLHAYKLEFKHPIKKTEMILKAKLPEDYENLYKKIGFNYKIEDI